MQPEYPPHPLVALHTRVSTAYTMLDRALIETATHYRDQQDAWVGGRIAEVRATVARSVGSVRDEIRQDLDAEVEKSCQSPERRP